MYVSGLDSHLFIWTLKLFVKYISTTGLFTAQVLLLSVFLVYLKYSSSCSTQAVVR